MKYPTIPFVFLILVALAALPAAQPHSAFARGPKVDPRVLEDTADGKTGYFLVVLQSQADARRAAMGAADRDQRGRLVFERLRQVAQASQPAVIAQLQALGAKYRPYYIVNLIAVEGNRTAVEVMAARPDVAVIESNRPFRVPLESAVESASAAASGIEWNLSWAHAADVWALGYTGQGRVYANADTGVQWNHPALQPHYRGWAGTAADHNYNWWDAIHPEGLRGDIGGGGNPCGFSSAVPCDDHWHGTHTMGIGVGDDGAGNRIGMAPGAQWIACRNMDQGFGQPSTYIECLEFFLAPWDLNGANPDPSKRPDVVGNSYSCPPSEGCSSHSLQVAVENVRAAGIFMAVSAGNSGPNCSTVTEPPGLEDAAITIGATGYQTNHIASFSSRGPVTVDGSNCRKPDLVAPGQQVRSSIPTDSYAYSNGTSMAAPHAAGAVALLWSAFPHLRGDVDHTEFILEQSALHLTTTQECGGDSASAVPNNVYGYGQLDVLAAYNYALGELTPTPSATLRTGPSATLRASPTATETVTPTATGTPTSTATPTPTPTPTAGASPSATLRISATASPTATSTPTPLSGKIYIPLAIALK